MAIASTDITKTIKQWYFAVKSEPGALAQVRILVLGLIACLTIYFGADSLLLAPKKKDLTAKKARLAEISATVSTMMPPGLIQAIEQMTQKKKTLMSEIDILKIKERFLQEEWQIISDPDRFTNIIFTSFPAAPVNIKKGLKQMSLVKPRTIDGFQVQPVDLAGTAAFHDFVAYLQYIESRSEAGPVENLSLEEIPAKEDLPKTKIHFNILVNRLKSQEAL